MSLPIALTSGDPAGVGPELTVRAWQELRDELAFFVIGDPQHFAAACAAADVAAVEIAEPAQAGVAMAQGLPVLPMAFAAPARSGVADPANGAGVIASIEQAVALVQAGHAAAVCTNPINKEVLIKGANFSHPGHTEFLAELGGVSRSVMMLTAPELSVVPVTIHIALKDVPAALTEAAIEQTIRISQGALQRDFGITAPRIAVAGLNPHAGEGGLMGREDDAVIAPVLERLRTEGYDLRGPLPADTMFHARARAGYDLALCMYHDQALIPIKTLNFDGGVNVTLGLPFIRTSPDHGTAFDIAGKGIARPDSLIAALRKARDMAARRMAYDLQH